MKKIDAHLYASIRFNVLTGIGCGETHSPALMSLPETGDAPPTRVGSASHFDYSFGTQDTMEAGRVGELPAGGSFHHPRFLLQVYPFDQVYPLDHV
jgi:hypothetical protein